MLTKIYQRLDDRRGCLSLAVLSLTLLLAGLLACAAPEIDAHWRSREIAIDGALSDWQGLQVALPKAPARLAVANDGTDLYLSLATDDPGLERQLAFRGLEIWFDPAGGKAKVLGLRLHGAGPPPGLFGRDRDRSGDEPGSRREPGAIADRPDRPDRFDRPEGVELLGPDPGQHRWVKEGEEGVRSAVSRDGSLVYELRLPLQMAKGWSLGAKPGGRFGIGFLTPEREGRTGDDERGGRAEGRGPDNGGSPGRPPGGGGPPGGYGGGESPGGGGYGGPGGGFGGGRGGFGGRGGRGGGGGRGGRSGSRGGPSEPLEAWAVLRLAQPGAS